MPSTVRTWPVLLLLSLACAAMGSWFLVGQYVGRAALLVTPEAFGVPAWLPPLRAWPLGGTYWLVWLADIAGVVVLLTFVWRRLAASDPDRIGRRFLDAWWAVPVGLLLANLLRLLAWSVLGSYPFSEWLAGAAISMVLSLVAGLVIGLPLGIVHALLGRKGGRGPRGAGRRALTDLPPSDSYGERAPLSGGTPLVSSDDSRG